MSAAASPAGRVLRRPLRSRLLFGAVNVGAWLLFACLASAWIYGDRLSQGVSSSYLSILRRSIPFWMLWTLPTVLVFRLVHRFPWSGGLGRPRTLLLHLAVWLLWMPVYAALLFPTVSLVFDVPLRHLVAAPRSVLGLRYFVELSLYWPILAVATATQAVRAQRDQERLHRELLEARLLGLRSQLEPHFLFNTLAAISGSLRAGALPEAQAALARLAELLREVAGDRGGAMVPLAEELSFARSYLELQTLRIGDRLRVRVDVEPGLDRCEVPSLLLQPLLENAFTHGVANVAGDVQVSLRIGTPSPGLLAIEVENPVAATNPLVSTGRRGIGLENTRSRLDLLYQGRAELSLTVDGERGRARARAVIPA